MPVYDYVCNDCHETFELILTLKQHEVDAKCPKCDATITKVIAGHVPVEIPMGEGWNGIAYACPSCRTP